MRILALLLLIAATSDTMAQEQFQLPPPNLKGTSSLEEALQSRRSMREFSEAPLSLGEIGQLLWAAQGITDMTEGLRTAPSAGALYPLELYLIGGRIEGLPPGIYRYDPAHHRLDRRSDEDSREALSSAALDQGWIARSSAIVVIAGVETRLSPKYGQRATRFMTLEAGHAAQNLLLEATALKLAAAPAGAFDDAEVTNVLHLPKIERPLYLLPIGRP